MERRMSCEKKQKDEEFVVPFVSSSSHSSALSSLCLLLLVFEELCYLCLLYILGPNAFMNECVVYAIISFFSLSHSPQSQSHLSPITEGYNLPPLSYVFSLCFIFYLLSSLRMPLPFGSIIR